MSFLLPEGGRSPSGGRGGRLLPLAFRVLAVLTLLGVCTGTASADVITVGNLATSTGNAFPFGGARGGAGTRYQQVYDASLFSGPVQIESISFFRGSPGTFRSGNYEFRLSTTSRAVDQLDTMNFNSNVGPDDALFFQTNLAGSAPSLLTLNGTDFLYDPSQGNLLLDILVAPTNPRPGGFSVFFRAHNGDFPGNDSSRAHNFGLGFAGFGLVTRFQFQDAVIPEPASLLLFGAAGVAGLVYARRRRTQVA